MSDTVAIRLENLSKTFGFSRARVEAVKNLTLTIAVGQVYGFLGPNGAGKTTTIRMLLDLIRPTRGSAYIFGQHIQRQHSVLRRVGAIAEGPAFYPFLSGRRNLEILARTANRYDPGRITSLLEQVGLAERTDQQVRGYSLGMKQRLGLAAALLDDPALLILDEPTNGLDPAGMQEIRQFIRAQADQHGKTVFLSSHLLNEVEQICDRVAIIHRGSIVREGAVAELLSAKNEVRVEAEPSEKAIGVLDGRYPVRQDEGNALIIEAPREAIPSIARLLIEQGIDLYHIASQRQSLEEYFLSVTQREEKANAKSISG